MNSSPFDLLTRRLTLATSRRGSLPALGGTALAAAAADSMAGKAKKGKNQKKANERCKQQVSSCQEVLAALCERFPGCIEADLLPCCGPLSTCQSGTALDCAFGYFNAIR